MARFSIGATATAGFGVIARRPLSVLAWGVVMLVLSVAPYLILLPSLGPDIVELMKAQLALGQAGANDQEAMQNIMRLQSGMMLLNIGSWLWGTLVNALIVAAIFRAVLEPRDKAFASLRLGARELWLTLLFLVETVLAYIVAVVFAMVVAVLAIIGVVALRAGGGGGDFGGAAVLGLIALGLIVGLAMLWLALRLSMAAPMTFAEGQFRLFESWRMTRGKGWSLLAVAVLAMIFVVVIEIFIAGAAIFATFALGLVPAWLTQPGHLEAMTGLPTQAQLLSLWPLLTLAGVAWAVLVSLVMTVFCAPWAAAYQVLSGRDAEPG